MFAKKPQGPPRTKIRTAQVCGLRTVRIFFARFYGLRTVRKICCRPGSAVSVPSVFFVFLAPPCHKSSTPPADNARLCQDGGLCRPSCCSPFVDQVLVPKTHKGGRKTKNYSYGLWPGPERCFNETEAFVPDQLCIRSRKYIYFLKGSNSSKAAPTPQKSGFECS